MKEFKKSYIVKSIAVKKYLELHGEKCLHIRDDRFDSRFSVFIFEDNKIFRQLLTTYTNLISKHNKV